MSERWRTRAAGAVALALVVTLGYALRPAETSPRKVLGEVVGLQLYAGMDPPPTSEPIPPGDDTSDAAPGRPGGYRRAVRFHDPLIACDEGAGPVPCGAKLEIFRRRSTAKDREIALANAADEQVLRKGALVLRMSARLPPERLTAYRNRFLTAVDELDAFRDLARLDRGDGR